MLRAAGLSAATSVRASCGETCTSRAYVSGEKRPISMSCQVLPRSVLRKRPMRTARKTVPGWALDTVSACASSMPSFSLSLPILLLRFGRWARLTRS